jgi:oligopeptide transport system substrate-binding protein
LDEIIFNSMNSFQALQAFRRGEIDWIGYPLGSWLTSFEPMQDDQVISFPNGSVCWHVFNTSKWPFNNTKLRQAIAYAIERTAFCNTAAIKITPAHSALLPQHINNKEARFPDPNHETARKLWEEGWKELGIELSQIPRLSLIYHSKGIRDHVVAHIRTQLNEVLGVDCECVVLSWDALFQRMTKGDFQMGLMHWVTWINDPVYTLNGFRFEKEDTNFSKWENPALQRLLDKSDQEIDPEKRKLYFSEAEEILCREMPVIPLFYQPFMAMVKKNLSVTYNVSRAVFNFARCFYKK